MAVIKCSNCENDILDSEIVCPYCDCPISETIKRMKNDDLQSYSDNLVTDLTGKVPVVTPETSPEEFEIVSDFEKKKAEILKELDTEPEITYTAEDNKNNNEAFERDADEEIFENSNEEVISTAIETQSNKDDTTPMSVVTNSADQTVKISREDLAKSSAIKNGGKKKNSASQKSGKAENSNKLIWLATATGLVVIALLIWGLASLITGGSTKPEEPEKPAVSEPQIKSDANKGYELNSTTLTITDNSVMKDYDSPNETPWYKHRNKIKHVAFADGITKIGAHSFEGFEKITDITIPDSVEKIGESAFCNCTSLKEISKMSKNITEIDDYAFTGCKVLGKIPGYTIEADFEPTIERIGIEAFKSCKALEEFSLPMYTEIGTDAFYGHGDKFVLVCETTSEAYDYAIEKGIPTKLGFGDEIKKDKPEENQEAKAPEKETQKPSENKPSQENKPESSQAPSANTPKPAETPTQSGGKSLSELLKQLENATTQEEKDRILSEIDKITQ